MLDKLQIFLTPLELRIHKDVLYKLLAKTFFNLTSTINSSL